MIYPNQHRTQEHIVLQNNVFGTNNRISCGYIIAVSHVGLVIRVNTTGRLNGRKYTCLHPYIIFFITV